MAGPLTTLLLPTYRAERFVGETVESLLRQTHSAFELVVVDNVSDDDTLEVIRSFRDPRVRIVEPSEHVGFVANFNRAVALVGSPLFGLCHADDVYEPGWLEAVGTLLRARPRAFMAHCRVRAIDEEGHFVRSRAERYKERFWPREDPCERPPAEELAVLRRGNYVLMPSVLYRTAAVRRLGPFREDLAFAVDWEYWLRGVLAGYTMAGTHRRLVRYRRHPAQTTRLTERSLSRYEDEIAIPEWIAARARAAGLPDEDAAGHAAATNPLLSELARRLAGGDREGAAVLLDFARRRVPGFAGSLRGRAARLGVAAGRPGGLVLRAVEGAYLAAWDALLALRRLRGPAGPAPVQPGRD